MLQGYRDYSVFFPTGYPDRKHPAVGLVASQQEQLAKLASIFPSPVKQNGRMLQKIGGVQGPPDASQESGALITLQRASASLYTGPDAMLLVRTSQ